VEPQFARLALIRTSEVIRVNLRRQPSRTKLLIVGKRKSKPFQPVAHSAPPHVPRVTSSGPPLSGLLDAVSDVRYCPHACGSARFRGDKQWTQQGLASSSSHCCTPFGRICPSPAAIVGGPTSLGSNIWTQAWPREGCRFLRVCSPPLTSCLNAKNALLFHSYATFHFVHPSTEGRWGLLASPLKSRRWMSSLLVLVSLPSHS